MYRRADRHAEDPAELTGRHAHARRLTEVARRDGVHDRVLHGRDRHRDARARDRQRRHHLQIGHPRLGDQRDPRHPCRLQQQADDDQRALADLAHERAGDRRHHEQRRRPRQQAQARVKRPLAERGLLELSHEEDRAEQAGRQQEVGGIAGREPA
jgi:hypothetical protein